MKLVSNSVVKIDTGFFWQNVKDHWGLTKPSVFSHEKSSYGVI
jgi:putative lipase involved disintegration of autophagic bodies